MEVNLSGLSKCADDYEPFSTKIVKDVIYEIFMKLSPQDLDLCRHINKEWNAIANDLIKKAIYTDVAFSPIDWNNHFGGGTLSKDENEIAFQLLPCNIDKILASPCPSFPNKRILDTHMLVWIPKAIKGQAVTISKFGELLKQKHEFSENPLGYNYIWCSIVKKEGDNEAEAGWVLMTTDVLPKSRNINFEDQQILVENLNKNGRITWKVPEMSESVICIYANYFKSGKRLFSKNPFTYTRCQENVKGGQVFVGGFDFSGLDIHNFSFYKHEYIGVATLRRF